MDENIKLLSILFPKLQNNVGITLVTSTVDNSHSLSRSNPDVKLDITDGKEHDINCVSAEIINWETGTQK